MKLRFLTSGESHGPALLVILEGLPAGLKLSTEIVNRELSRRQKGYGAGPRMKIEQDEVKFLAGVMAGMTTGSPLAMLIENKDHSKWRGKMIPPFTTPRPGHADLTGVVKYGYRDLRPALERASARETAGRVAVGAVCKELLSVVGIKIGGYVVAIGEITAEVDEFALEERSALAEESPVRCPDRLSSQKMEKRIEDIIKARDTLGGVIETFAVGVPPGLGSYVHWDRRLDARLGAAVLSIQAIKGIEIGPAFENSRLQGTEVHDPIRLQNGEIVRPSNRAGGLEGGVTNGQPILIRAAMKPIASTLKPQETIDIREGIEVPTQYERSDFCPVPRAVPIVEAMVAFVLADSLMEKLGGDTVDEIKQRCESLRGTKLSDLPMDGEVHIYWPDDG